MEFMFPYMKGFFQAGTNMKFNLSVKRNWITFSHFATAPFGHTAIWPRVQTVSERWKKECHLAGLVDLCSGKRVTEKGEDFFSKCPEGRSYMHGSGKFQIMIPIQQRYSQRSTCTHPLHDEKQNEMKMRPYWLLFGFVSRFSESTVWV